MDNKRYHTAGRAALVAYLTQHTQEKPQSAEEIYGGLSAAAKTPGRSSVYRQLGELADTGEVRRFRTGPAGDEYIKWYW